MRLGETKKIIEEVLNEENKIVIEHEPVYGGQAQSVSNYMEIVRAINLLSLQSWNKQEFAPIEDIKNKITQKNNPVTLDQADFNVLNQYVSQINNLVHLYYGILEDLSDEQEEYVINVKLPDGEVGSLSDLAKLNSRLDKIFKEINVDGEFEFKNFDLGTSWYILLAQGMLTYKFFISCLKIAQEFYKARQEYFKSEEAKLFYKATLKEEEKFNKDAFNNYIDKMLDLKVKERVNKAVEDIKEKNGQTESELQTKLIMATKNLIKELDEGVEFHLSLNPPTYAVESNHGIQIDYVKIKEIKAENSKPKQLK